jgi:hypothetical protein
MDPDEQSLVMECLKAYDGIVVRLSPAMAHSIDGRDCPALSAFVNETDDFGWDEHGQWRGLREDLACIFELASNFDDYLSGREGGQIETLEDLVKWNDDHPVHLTSQIGVTG